MSSRALRPLRQSERRFLVEQRVGRLATVDSSGRPHVIPVCFAISEATVFIALDEKPKTVDARRLQRVRNIQAQSAVALVVDEYSEDWHQLSYVLLRGDAHLVEPGDAAHANAVKLLRGKYPQYVNMAIDRQPIIQIGLTAVTSWSWTRDRFAGD